MLFTKPGVSFSTYASAAPIGDLFILAIAGFTDSLAGLEVTTAGSPLSLTMRVAVGESGEIAIGDDFPWAGFMVLFWRAGEAAN